MMHAVVERRIKSMLAAWKDQRYHIGFLLLVLGGFAFYFYWHRETNAMSGQPKAISADCELATLGGGCFWCLEGAFEQLKGVERVESGYMGGSSKDPTYKEVCTGQTGHAEVVQIAF